MKLNLRTHALFSVLAGIAVYCACLYYIELVTKEELEDLAAIAALCFLGCVYIGRYLSTILHSFWTNISNEFLILLAVLVFGCILWLFIYPDHSFEERPALNMLLYWMPYVILASSAGMFIKLLRLNQHRLQEARVSSAHSQSELQLLQSQLSPHFLFNTLNNLYGISLTRHEKIPPLLLKLSELLRYSVYEAKELFVPLKEEITYINNYIDFEKIRIGERLRIKTAIENIDDSIKIAPMLLIVFIENAFKHSKDSTEANISVDIELRTWNNDVFFSVKNSFQMNQESEKEERYSGLGLENTRKRLKLLYPNQHDLKQESTDGFYQITLHLQTKQDDKV